MYHPTSRVLTVLELLQSRPSITGPELAERLEMDVRTVRRYIMHLQDVGIPVEANIGRHGGYRLRPGFKLPPLLFTEEEATAIMLGLLGTSWLEIGQSAVAVEGALAKVSRVLPLRVRERLDAMSTHLFFFSPQQEARPDVSLLLKLSEAIGQQQRIGMDYRSHYNEMTYRKVEPYGIVGWDGRWYLVGYCCLRQDYRTFRLDRIQQTELLEESFERPEDFDCRAYVVAQHSREPSGWHIKVEFQAPLYTMQQKIPAAFGTLTATATGVLFESQFEDIAAMARYLMSLNQPFVIHEPQELREALLRLAERMTQIAMSGSANEPGTHTHEPGTHNIHCGCQAHVCGCQAPQYTLWLPGPTMYIMGTFAALYSRQKRLLSGIDEVCYTMCEQGSCLRYAQAGGVWSDLKGKAW